MPPPWRSDFSQMDEHDISHRFAFHPAITDEKKAQHGSIRHACVSLAFHINARCPDGREKSLAITHLEEVMFWANAAIARTTATAGSGPQTEPLPGV